MKKLILTLALFAGISSYAQKQHYCAEAKSKSIERQISIENAQKTAAPTAWISHEKAYDVKFVHLNLNCERNTKYISGNVKTVATVTLATLDTFSCLLHQAFTIDSIYINGAKRSFVRKDSIVKVKTASTYTNGQSVTAIVYYKGTAPTGGSAIGSGYSTGTSTSWGNQATWSLSESFVAYHWWPCKQELTDKIDSSWVFITTDSTNKVGSNGILKNVVTVGNKKRYEWKSKLMIDYYLISVAISKYKEYNLYAKPIYLPGDSILIQNYIYDGAFNNSSWISGQKVQLDRIKQTMEFLCRMYGMYPFYKEKYGHCMAPFSGGMEHQTMSSMGFFDFEIDAHELGHQWWGDNVTCKSWSDIWINEGFASYTEHLCNQYLNPTAFMTSLNSAHNNVMTQTGGSIHFTNSDTMNTSRIFSGRLTYDKGGAIVRTLQFEINNDSIWFPLLRGFQNTYKNSTASAVDFKNYAQTFTGMNFTQFFNQWYYGQGYPTFAVTWNSMPGKAFLKSVQSTSMPSSVPLFITPMEYKLARTGYPDTTIRVMHSNTTENYTVNLLGTVTSVTVDPNQWVINKVTGPTKDITLGVDENYVWANDITITPNPSNGIYEINSEKAFEGSVEVVDVTGKLILSQPATSKNQIDITREASGVYYLAMKDKSGNIIRSAKLIKE